MKALIAELTMRDMNHLAVAAFLKCSCTSARNYMKELLEAEVVMLPQRGKQRFVIDRADYCITSDSKVIANFLDAQDAVGSSLLSGSKGLNGSLQGRQLHIVFDDVKFPVRISNIKARRDPLVAALFGRAGGAGE